MKIATCVPYFLDQIPRMATIFISLLFSVATIQVRLLFKGGYYSRVATIQGKHFYWKPAAMTAE